MTNQEVLLLAVEKGYHVTPAGEPHGPNGPLRGSLHRGGKRKGEEKPTPYRAITLRIGRATRSVPVHRIQAYQKFGDRLFEEGVLVRHLDSNSLNNEENNLELGTAAENSLDRDPELRQAQAQHAANARRAWTADEVRALRQRRKQGERCIDLAAEQGVSKGQMSGMLNGRTYKNVE
jgi:hypothetical protein